MKKLLTVCIALLAVTACSDDESGNPGEVIANTDDIHSIMLNSAVVEATVYGNGITDRGICWADTENPTLADESVSDGKGGAGSYSITINGLDAGTRYYARAYATISDGKILYGSSRSFVTIDAMAVSILSTTPEDKTIYVSASITGGSNDTEVSERGICYATSANPTVSDAKVAASSAGKGDFDVVLNDLEPETTYHLRAYAVTNNGIQYSNDQTVTTLEADSPETFWSMMRSANIMYGVVRDEATRFVMHYTIDVENSEIAITYIESTGDKDAVHETRTFTMTGTTEITWDAVSDGTNEFRGISRTAANFSVIGSGGLALTSSMSAGDIYSIFVHANHGGISRCSELDRGGNEHGSLTSIWGDSDMVDYIEYNGDRTAITVKGENYRGYMYRQNTFENGAPYIPIEQDVAFFSFAGIYMDDADWAMKDPTAIQETVARLQPFLDLWENSEGVIIIQETTGKTPTDGDFHFYAVHPSDVTWVRWRLRAYGS